MRIHFLLAFLFFQASNLCLCQNSSIILSLFYEINQIQSEINFKRLDSVCELIKDNKAEIKIMGSADFLSTDHFNKQLSEKRALAVKNYLLKKQDQYNLSITQCEGVGEKNSKPSLSKLGVAADRRVDVFLTLYSFKQINSMERNSEKYSGLDTVENVKVALPSQPSKNPEVNLSKKINELKKGESLAIEGLLFIPGRHVAIQSSMPVLQQLVLTLKEHPKLKIEIQGHICCLDDQEDGFDYDNLDKKLSENRAKAVYEYLVKNGIDAGRLTYKGYGHKNPKIFPELTQNDEQMNRRVEIKVIEE